MATEAKSSVVKVKPSGNQDGSSVNKKKVVDSKNKIAKTEVYPIGNSFLLSSIN